MTEPKLLWLRQRMPDWLRRIGRTARAVATPASTSPPMPRELIAECRVCANRDDLVLHMPRGGRVAEVGVQRGLFSRHILAVSDPHQLDLIDLDFSLLEPDVRADSRAVMHQGDSAAMLASFADATFDWIYIDADHSYEGCARDARAAAPKLKPGGYLLFNDFAHVDPRLSLYGVHRAVVEFMHETRWPMVWWAYQPDGLYDVALRKPG